MRQSIKTRLLVATITCGLLYGTATVAGGPGHAGMPKDGMFKMMDTNNDGRISAVEHDAHSRAMFASADANKDGSVTAAEMQGAMRMHRGKHDGKADHDHMRKVDSDRDGRISSAEFTVAHPDDPSKFVAYDSNKDGFISMDEMKARHQAMGKKDGHDSHRCSHDDKHDKSH